MTTLKTRMGACAVGAVLLAGCALPAAAAETRSGALPNVAATTYPGEGYSQYYRRGGGYYRGRRGYGGGAVAGGVIGGLALGALAGAAIAGSQPAYGYGGPGVPVGNVYGADPNWVNYCASRYRSFDPRTGTYLARDGYRYPCE